MQSRLLDTEHHIKGCRCQNCDGSGQTLYTYAGWLTDGSLLRICDVQVTDANPKAAQAAVLVHLLSMSELSYGDTHETPSSSSPA